MNFRDIDIKKEYRSLLDNVARDFYIPLLSRATLYQRAVGFFSSTALIEISKGITALAQNGGKIQLVASPYLSDEDITAIKNGYQMRDKIVKAAVLRELKPETSVSGSARLNLLANLIADDILDIKIAFTEDEDKLGMYHEKMGIITDADHNQVAFAGSMNESATAMTLNYETIDVYCSWKGEEERVRAKENAFVSIWGNTEPNISIIDFPELKQEIIDRYKRAKPDYDLDRKELEHETGYVELVGTNENYPKFPDGFHLHDYQEQAIEEWKHQGFCGIFDMATGTGKTYTGLGALTTLAQSVDNKLAAIIVCPYQHLVEQWVEDIEKFNIHPIIGYSGSSQKDWKKQLEDAIRDQKLRVRNREFCLSGALFSTVVMMRIDGAEVYKRTLPQASSIFSFPYFSTILLRLTQALKPCSASLPEFKKYFTTCVVFAPTADAHNRKSSVL